MSNENKDPLEMLGELSKNPEILKSIMEALTAARSEGQSTAEDTAPAPSDIPPMPDLSAMLSDPQTLAKISGVMSMLKSSEASSQTGSQATSAQALAQQSSGTPSPDRSAALLLALKPYLSEDRQAAIENLIKFSKFGEILKNM